MQRALVGVVRQVARREIGPADGRAQNASQNFGSSAPSATCSPSRRAIHVVAGVLAERRQLVRGRCAPPSTSSRAAGTISQYSAASCIEMSIDAPVAAALAAEQRGQDPDHGRHRAAADVGDEHARQRRHVRPIGGEKAGHRDVVQIVSRPLGVRPGLAVAGDRAVDEARVPRAHVGGGHAEPPRRAGPKALDARRRRVASSRSNAGRAAGSFRSSATLFLPRLSSRS